MTAQPRERVDVAVAGAGVAGLATALALVCAGGPVPRVLVCDPWLADGVARAQTLRAVAIAPASRRFLERLGVWSGLAPDAQPILRMVLGDSRPDAMPAPTFLRFEDATADEPIAHMVLHDGVRAGLLAACAARGIAFLPAAVHATTLVPGGLALGDTPWQARLVVAADGARSRLREGAGLRSLGRDYGQSAIVATLDHTRDHGGEALQVFLPGGPLAFLPLRSPDGAGRRSSIVWTEATAEAERIGGLGRQAFCDALLARGGQTRGDLTLVDAPVAYPLAVRMARGLVAERLALVGDAARTIHPLAGQGLNLGLQDAETLAAGVTAAMGLGLDPGSHRVLAAYQTARRPDQVAMAAATHGLNRLFSNDSGPLRLLRDVGLGLVEGAPGLKRAFVRRASGA